MYCKLSIAYNIWELHLNLFPLNLAEFFYLTSLNKYHCYRHTTYIVKVKILNRMKPVHWIYGHRWIGFSNMINLILVGSFSIVLKLNLTEQNVAWCMYHRQGKLNGSFNSIWTDFERMRLRYFLGKYDIFYRISLLRITSKWMKRIICYLDFCITLVVYATIFSIWLDITHLVCNNMKTNRPGRPREGMVIFCFQKLSK